jgi:hypothetical protein
MLAKAISSTISYLFFYSSTASITSQTKVEFRNLSVLQMLIVDVGRIIRTTNLFEKKIFFGKKKEKKKMIFLYILEKKSAVKSVKKNMNTMLQKLLNLKITTLT